MRRNVKHCSHVQRMRVFHISTNPMSDPEKLRCYGGPLDGETHVLIGGESLIEPGDYVQTGHGKVHRSPGVMYKKREFYKDGIIIAVLIATTEEVASFSRRILHEDWNKHDASAKRVVTVPPTDLRFTK